LEISNISWDAIPGPNRGLRAKYSITAQSNEEYYLLSYAVTLNLGAVEVGTRTRHLSTDVAYGRPASESVEFRIPPYLFQAIEESRGGKDLPVQLTGTVLVGKHIKDRPAELCQFHAFGLGGQISQKFSRDEWSDLVEKMGLRGFGVIELRRPAGPAGEAIKAVEARIQDSQRILEHGGTDHVVDGCRKALETLGPLVLEPAGGTPGASGVTLNARVAAALDEGSVGQTGLDQKSQRVLNLHVALWRFVHVGAHGHYHVSPEDAEYAVWATSLLASYYSKTLAPPGT
jgi:hypothetical protein